MMGGIRSQKGFTLVEIMMVVIIIGILAVLAIPRYEKYTIESKLSEVAVSVGEIKTGMEKYYNSHGNKYAAPSDDPGVDTRPHEILERTLRIDLGGGENFLFKVVTDNRGDYTGYVVIARLSETGQRDHYQSSDLGDRVVFYFPRELNTLYTSEAWIKGWNDDDFFIDGQSTVDGMGASTLQ